MPRLDGKLCVVTGAARGIGAAIARAFVAEGAEVVLTDLSAEDLAPLADELGQLALPLDVSSEEDWAALADAVPECDVMVNNAGITGLEHGAVHDPEHAALADWQQVHRVNTDGTFLGCRYAIQAMRQRGAGSIINISSRSGIVGIPGAAAYAASKAAMRNHTKTVALYCAGQGLNIRCNSIHPAAVLTPIWEPMLGEGAARQERMDALVADTPLRRFGRPEEVAALCILLASDECPYMTGSELTVDGGILAGSAASPGGAEE